MAGVVLPRIDLSGKKMAVVSPYGSMHRGHGPSILTELVDPLSTKRTLMAPEATKSSAFWSNSSDEIWQYSNTCSFKSSPSLTTLDSSAALYYGSKIFTGRGRTEPMADMHEGSTDDFYDEDIPLADMISAVDRLDPSDPDWADLHWHVADLLYDRYLETEDPTNLNDAIDRGRRVVTFQQEQSAPHLHELALMLWSRFERSQGANDISEYIRLLETSLVLLRSDNSDEQLRAEIQANLATGLASRNPHHISDQDIARATTLWQTALASKLLETDVQAGIAANIAQALSREGASESDLRKAVEFGRLSLNLPAPDPYDVAYREFSLASALASLHSLVEEEGLLNEAISLTREGLAHLGDNDPDALGYKSNLIGLLRQQARETGQDGPLDEALLLARDIVKQADTSPDRILILSTTATVLSEAADLDNDTTLVKDAIELYRRAIALSADSPHEQGVALTNLASTCRDANERLDAPDLIKEGIRAGSRALAIFQHDGIYRAAALAATGNCLRDSFVLSGALGDLNQAIKYSEEALELTPERHTEWAARLTNLAVLLSDDYAERADRAQLDRAISLYRRALEARERVGVRVAERLNDLALALRDRHKDTRNAEDLREAIELAEEALNASHPGKLVWSGYANNLGNAFAERYELAEDIADLNRAINLFEQALADAKDRVIESSGYATNIGLALATRAHVTGSLEDMSQALVNLNKAIELLPAKHPDRTYRIANLSDVYRQRSQMMARIGREDTAKIDAQYAVETAESGVATAERAMEEASTSDARLLPALSNLAGALRWQQDLVPDSSHSERILAVQRRAAKLDEITPAEKFVEAGHWAQDAEKTGLVDEALRAYEQAVVQTTAVAWIGLTFTERLSMLRMMHEILSRAVTCAVAAHKPWTALVWADHVRSVLWRQGIQANTVGDSLNEDEVVSLSNLQSSRPGFSPDTNAHNREQRRNWAHLNQDAQLMSLTSSERYRELSFPGVMVLLVPGDTASYALLIQTQNDPIQIDLPHASRENLTTQVKKFRQAIASFATEDGNIATNELSNRHAIFDCLGWLWDAVAEPILNMIESPAETRPQIWWSPVGEFALLPVHAAGHHPRKMTQFGQMMPNEAATVQDRARSSYLPTILGSHYDSVDTNGETPRLLYVSANDELSSLTNLDRERETILASLAQTPVDELNDPNATAASLGEKIQTCSYLHIAAHGTSSTDHSAAGFHLSDGLFSLRDLAKCRAPYGKLATLLTCDSAAGDVLSPNEALHTAGAAHQAGFSNVIAATMPMRDASTLPVVEAVYRALEEYPDQLDAAVPAALDIAVLKLRLDPTTGTDPLSWVPYAHFRAGLDFINLSVTKSNQ